MTTAIRRLFLNYDIVHMGEVMISVICKSFTALCVVLFLAFSFAGLANEIEEKKIELKPIEKEYATILKPCYAVYLDTYQSAIDNGANETQAGNVAWAAYSSCTGL